MTLVRHFPLKVIKVDPILTPSIVQCYRTRKEIIMKRYVHAFKKDMPTEFKNMTLPVKLTMKTDRNCNRNKTPSSTPPPLRFFFK